MVRPGKVEYPIRHRDIWISGPLGAELPYLPIGSVLAVEEGEEVWKGIAIVAFGVCA